MHAEAFLEGTPVALYCLCSFDKLDPAVDGSDEQRAERQARQLAGSIATCRRCGRESEITDLLRPFKFTFNAHRELPVVEFDLAFICPNRVAWRLVPGYALPDKRVHPPRDTDYSF